MPSSRLIELYLELKDRQRRIGTAQELDDDFARILDLSHQINNQVTAIFLRESISRKAALAAVRQLAPGSCDGEPVSLTASALPHSFGA